MSALNERDASRLRDMLENARLARQFMQGKGRADLDTDPLLAYAVVRALEVIGEAAHRVSPNVRAAMPEVEWVNIIGMRHRIVHGYDSINADVVFTVVQDRLPVLMEVLLAALRPMYPDLDA
ncbi:MAG: HepT-like ribonuclease domain-containing protein [Anaerolinea sp.]